MPFVPTAEARNAHLTRVSFAEPAAGPAFHRDALIASPSMRLVLIEMPAGHRTIPHRHPGAGEYFLILAGSGRFTIGDDGPLDVGAGDLLFAATDEPHVIEAGAGGLRLLAGVGPNEDRPDEEVTVDGYPAAAAS